MEPGEHETIILINDVDRREGYFTFSTSKTTDYSRLLKRIGGESNLLALRTRTAGKIVVYWECKVPNHFMSRATWAIRPKSNVKRGFALKTNLDKGAYDTAISHWQPLPEPPEGE